MAVLITRGGQRVDGIWVDHDRWLVAEEGPYTLERSNGIYYSRGNDWRTVGCFTDSMGRFQSDEEAEAAWRREVARMREERRRMGFWKEVM